jgi:hypothetical protein
LKSDYESLVEKSYAKKKQWGSPNSYIEQIPASTSGIATTNKNKEIPTSTSGMFGTWRSQLRVWRCLVCSWDLEILPFKTEGGLAPIQWYLWNLPSGCLEYQSYDGLVSVSDVFSYFYE